MESLANGFAHVAGKPATKAAMTYGTDGAWIYHRAEIPVAIFGQETLNEHTNRTSSYSFYCYRLTNPQIALGVFNCDMTAHPSSSGRTVYLTVGKDTCITDVGRWRLGLTRNYGSIKESQVLLRGMANFPLSHYGQFDAHAYLDQSL